MGDNDDDCCRTPDNDDDGLEARPEEVSSSEDQKDLDRIMMLESKLSEKEGFIETIEHDLNVLRQRFEAINEELKTTEEEKENLEDILAEEKDSRANDVRESSRLTAAVEEMSSKLSALEEVETQLAEVQSEKTCLESQQAELLTQRDSLEARVALLESSASETSDSASQLGEKYQESVRVIEELQRKLEDASSESESVEADNEAQRLKVSQCEAEIQGLQEQVESSENKISDLREAVAKLTERRNSLDASREQQRAEIAEYQSQISVLQSQPDLRAALRQAREEKEEKEAEVVEQGREREVLQRELESLRAVVIEVSGENSVLQDRLSEMERRETAGQSTGPPPDITNNQQLPPPDVASASRNIDPDLTAAASNIQRLANPDIMDHGDQEVGGDQDWGQNWFDQQQPAPVQQQEAEPVHDDQHHLQPPVHQPAHHQLAELEGRVANQAATITRLEGELSHQREAGEVNSNALQVLESNIWEVTDARNQLLAQTGHNEHQLGELREALGRNQAELSTVQQQLVVRTEEVETLLREKEQLTAQTQPSVSPAESQPGPAEFTWNTASTEFFSQPQQSTAGSFFEDLGSSPAVPQTENYLAAESSPQQQQPEPPAGDEEELCRLQEELGLKIVLSEQLAAELQELKLQLAELEAKSGQLILTNQTSEEEKVCLRTELSSATAQNNQLEEERVSLTAQVSELQQRISLDSGRSPEPVVTQDQNTTATSSFTELSEPTSQEAPSTAALFHQEQPTASSFFTEDQSQAASSFFTETHVEDQNQTASSFFTDSPAQDQIQASSSFFTDSPAQDQNQAPAQSALPSASDLRPEQLVANLDWYQEQLGQYQQACQDWTLWGEEKTREVSELKEHLSYQTEAFRIKAAETEKLREKLQEQEEAEKRNDQGLMKLKELEIADLRESLERLESEKEEGLEELTEMRNTVAELRSLSETVENYNHDSAELLDTRTRLEEVEGERTKMVSELSDLRNEMATTQFSNDKTIKDLRKDFEEKLEEIEQLKSEKSETSQTILQLENSLAEEKKMQEEIGDEYETMQLQVQESAGRVTDLLKEIEALKEQLVSEGESSSKSNKAEVEVSEKVAELTSELEQYRQTCNDWNTWAEVRNTEYQQLLEAYTGYVEAYNNLQAEQKPTEVSSVEVDSLREELAAKTEELHQLTDSLEKSKETQAELDRKLAEATSSAEETEQQYQTALMAQQQLEQKLLELTAEAESQLRTAEESYQTSLQTQEENYQESLQSKEESYQTSLQTQEAARVAAGEREAQLRRESEEREKVITDLQQSLQANTEQQEEDVGSKARAEYDTLLEAYNQYVVAYDYLNTEYAKLQTTLQEGPQQPDLQPSLDGLQQQLQKKEAELESLRQQVEVKEKELVEKTATIAKMSISSALSSPMSRAVEEEEGWGLETAEVQQSSVSEEVLVLETELSELKNKLRTVEEEKTAAKLKSGKLLVKVKQLTKEVETLKKKAGQSSGELDDLDRALQDEVKLQAEKVGQELREVKKELESIKLEKTHLVRKVDTLESGNDRLVELKEKQDNEVQFLQFKLKEVTSQVAAQQWELTELQDQRDSELSDLRSRLAVFTSSGSESSEGEARLEVAALTSQLAAARQEADRLSSDLAVVSGSLAAAQSEAATVKSQQIDLQDSIDRLTSEREELQAENRTLQLSFSSSSSSAGAYEEIVALNNSLNAEIASLKQFVQSGSPSLATPEPGSGSEPEVLREQVRREQQLVVQLERDLQLKEESLRQLEEELFLARDSKVKKEEELRTRRDSARESLDREVFAVFSDKNLVLENQRLKTDLDNVSRERRHLSERISRWEEELSREDIDVLGEAGLRQELRVAIQTLQLRDHK